MKLTTLLASSAALAAIAIAVPATIAPSWSPVTTAQAATSISFSLFYDGLDDYGDWVSHDGDYVFVPVIDNRDWQPYTEGHWVYARGYGWTWVSDEPFGWATYHYGRWGFDDDLGWYWVPGTRWAPAWVSWRRSGDHVAWAPLPPHRGGGDDISISISFGDIPDYYWVAVPSRSFLEVNLNVVIIDDDRERRRIVRDSEFVGGVQIENNIVVNNVLNINYVEENTGRKVKEVEVKKTDNPATAKASDGQVEVFEGKVEPDKTAKPPKLKEVTEVKENQGEAKKKVKAESGEPAATPDDQATQSGEESPAKKKVKAEQPEGQATGTEVEQTETPADKKKKLKVDQTEGAATGTDNVEQAATPADKKTKKKVDESQASAPVEEAADPAAQPGQKKDSKKKAKTDETVVDGAIQPDESQPAAEEQTAKKDKKGKKDKSGIPCDPTADMATQEGCVVQ
ncbi:MAG TPA: DUF6600 domain-containing protein [Aestuariivirga sp.]|nr:DUF6600 domain-containing protein [Aestuariivirga sp.]